MNGKLAVVVVGAAVLVGAAGFLLTRRPAEAPEARGAFLPNLKANIGKVARVELHRGDESIELARSGDDWVLASSGGYPAKVDGVRAVTAGLAGLEIDEALTAKRERHGELGLAWPDAKKQAALVRLLDAGGAALDEVVLGEERFTPASRYVRRLSEDQTYRCRGNVAVDTTVRSYVDTEVLSLKTDDIESIAYEALVLSPNEDKTWKAEFGPSPVDESTWTEEQRKAASTTLPQWASRIDFDDVRRRDRAGATWTPDPAYGITYFAKTATISVEGMKDGTAVWLRVSAAPTAKAAATAAAAPADGQPAPDAAKDAGAEAKPAGADAKPAGADANSAAPAAFDWKAWSDRMSAWEFKLPEWKVGAITKIREAKAPAPPPAAPPVPGGAGLPFPPPGGG